MVKRASWMGRKLSDAEREAQAVELEPGVMASPWERDACAHGKAYPVRWTWAKGEDIADAEPVYGKHGCKECDE